jgi:hypothetical protein
MMKFIGHLLALLLSAALSITVMLWTLGYTLGSATYLEHQADQAKLYDQLHAQIPAVDPAAIQGQVHTILPQLIDHLLKGTPNPVVDFGSGPVNIGVSDPKILSITNFLPTAALYAALAIVILIGLIIVITRGSCWSVLSRAAFGAATGLGLSSAIFWFSPNVILSLLNKPDTLPIKTALAPFLTSVFHDLATRLAIAALTLLAASVLIRLIEGAGHLKSKFSKQPKADKSAKPPFPGIARS